MRQIMSALRRLRKTSVYLSLMACCAGACYAAENAICDVVIVRASEVTDVPVDVLRAVARAASGQNPNDTSAPPPWSVRIAGKHHQFETREAALLFVFARFIHGVRSFDVGCFHLSYTATGTAFASIEEMFDPQTNALFAADMLRRLHASTGSWKNAVKASFAQRPETVANYQRYERIFLSLPPLQPSLFLPLQTSLTNHAGSEPLIADATSSAAILRVTNAAVGRE